MYDSLDNDQPSWVNIPMLIFIVISLVPYGMTLNYQYKQMNPAQNKSVVSCSSVSMVCFLLKAELFRSLYLLVMNVMKGFSHI